MTRTRQEREDNTNRDRANTHRVVTMISEELFSRIATIVEEADELARNGEGVPAGRATTIAAQIRLWIERGVEVLENG